LREKGELILSASKEVLMRNSREWFWDSKIQSRNNRLSPRRLLKCFGLPALAALLCVPGVQTHKSNTVAPKAAKSTAKRVARPRASEDYGRLPLSFEVNQGQTDAQVSFLARGQGYTLFLTRRKRCSLFRGQKASVFLSKGLQQIQDRNLKLS
jgi:hypothetical protein